MEQPLPDAWHHIIERNVPYYRCLTPVERKELGGLVQVFIAEKYFEGCGGLQMSDEIKVTIAAQACMLLLGREHNFYPALRTVLVYPSAWFAPTMQREGWIVSEGEEWRSGESWDHGAIVLSWDDVLGGARDMHDGWNVVFHEFAHQLDAESGSTEGVPELPERAMYATWAKVLSREYEEFIFSLQTGGPTLLDAYGAKNPAEFFAVATEFFFERPVELRALHPRLYEQLRLFYRRDTAETMQCLDEGSSNAG
jgi:Mlc titration factor MtfA (ptsG expression regulator)